MKSSNLLKDAGIKPGFTLIHKNVKALMSRSQTQDLKITEYEANVIKLNLEDYLMYIWLYLGDTRYNRSGYRNAFEALEQHINKNF